MSNIKGNLYLVEDLDGGAEYAHLFILPVGLSPEEADVIMEREITVLQEDFTDWNWDDAIRVLTRMGWTHLPFEVCANAY